MMTEYRKRTGIRFYAWHFRSDCSNWPTWNYTSRTRDKKPRRGPLCDQCQAKARHGK